MANPNFKFEKAKRLQLKASIMVEGLPGEGKSGLALLLGYYLADKKWEDVSHIDTENKSGNLFAGIPFSNGTTVGEFMIGQLTEDVGYKPSNYLAFRQLAAEAGAKVVIEDSISHAWQYKGGLLDLVNAATERSGKNDKYAAWRDPEVSAEKNRLLTLIRSDEVHVISTVRVKERFEYVTGADGKNSLQSMGEQQIQQADLKYEADLVLHMVKAGSATEHPVARVIKTRYAILKKDEEYEFTPALCEQLRVYLSEGVDPEKLLEQQRLDYVTAAKEYLDQHPNAVNIWKVLKNDAGHAKTKLEELPLNILKMLYTEITIG